MPAQRKTNRLRVAEGEPPVPLVNLGGGIGTPDPPGWLPEVGREEWRRVVSACEAYPTWLQQVDVALLTAYAATWATWKVAAQDIADRGALVPARSSADGDALVKNPAVQIARDAAAQLRSLCRELGFSPDARGRIEVGRREDDADAGNPFDVGGAL